MRNWAVLLVWMSLVGVAPVRAEGDQSREQAAEKHNRNLSQAIPREYDRARAANTPEAYDRFGVWTGLRPQYVDTSHRSSADLAQAARKQFLDLATQQASSLFTNLTFRTIEVRLRRSHECAYRYRQSDKDAILRGLRNKGYAAELGPPLTLAAYPLFDGEYTGDYPVLPSSPQSHAGAVVVVDLKWWGRPASLGYRWFAHDGGSGKFLGRGGGKCDGRDLKKAKAPFKMYGKTWVRTEVDETREEHVSRVRGDLLNSFPEVRLRH
jgi:hypothetical protein